MIDFSPFHRFVDSFRKICLERTLTSESAVADVNTPSPNTHSRAFSVCLSLQTEMGDGLGGGAGGCCSLPGDNHRFSFALTTPSVGVLPEKKEKKRKSDPILCLKLKQIEDIRDFLFYFT